MFETSVAETILQDVDTDARDVEKLLARAKRKQLVESWIRALPDDVTALCFHDATVLEERHFAVDAC